MERHIFYLDLKGKKPFPEEEFKTIEVASKDLLGVMDKALTSYTRANKNLRTIYRRLTNYSNSFYLSLKSSHELVIVPDEGFIGREHELPNPSARLLESFKSEVYFSPRDRKFIGFARSMQPEILELAMPGISMRIWEQSGYFNSDSGRSFLDINVQMHMDQETCANPEFRKDEIQRDVIISNLEFLLGFIPKTTPQIIDEKTTEKLKKECRK
ncbi:hypothetical protein HYT23_01505 [Candidatus Pacearchaeota archaeon]|nr:hypothetical protein [Candidatus Pacearchaeota archaeon]